MAQTRNLQLFSEYSESGYRGETEFDTTYTIEATGVHRETLVVLVIEKKTTDFPSHELRSKEVSRYQIAATALADYIRANGTVLPES